MTGEERRLMKRIDDIVLGGSHENIEELRQLDIETQLSGMSFYDNVVNSGSLERAKRVRVPSKK